MTPAQLAAYSAVCEADPECRCTLVDLAIPHDPTIKPQWFETRDDVFITDGLAAAVLADHLHTRYQVSDPSPDPHHVEGFIPTDQAEILWKVTTFDRSRPFHESVVYLYGGPSKLSAYLAAHIVRLGLDRSLITAMKDA
jgi:hypothetical protein